MITNKDTFLREEQYYIDLHDLHTIEQCLDYGMALYSKLPEIMSDPKLQSISEEKRNNDWLRSINIVVHSIKVSRFKDKKTVIDEWMQKDRIKQERFNNAQEDELYCSKCKVLLQVFLKELYDRSNSDLKILFFYKCPRCNFRTGKFDTGEEYESKPMMCDKCGSEVDVQIKTDEKKDVTTWIYKCTGCDFQEKIVDDHKKWEEEQRKREKRDKELLDKYRAEFCFTEKEGNEAVLHSEQIARLVDNWKERDKKEKDPVYLKARSLKKLKVVEVNKLLREVLEKEGYIELQFEKPEMDRFVAVPFVVQDSVSDREDYDSRQKLKKLIEKVLEGSNWRLMSDGICYRVGYLSGRLRCYENEEDLIKLIN